VLVALAVIFLPMLVKGPAPDSGVSDLSLRVPDAPIEAGTIDLPLVEDDLAPPPAPEGDGVAELPSAPDQGTDTRANPAAQGAATESADAEDMLPASVASGQYIVHYATFATQPEADEMARQLQIRELPAFTQPSTFNSRPAVAVRIGPYSQRAEAETIRVRASQVRGDVRPLVLALDAEEAGSGQNAAASGSAGSASGASTPSTPPSTATSSARASTATPPSAATPSRPAAPARSASPPARQPPATTRASAPPATATGFVVQVGAFSNAASATNLQRRLRAANIPAFTDTVNTSRGRLTRVNAGPVSSRAEADRLKTRVKSAIGTDGIVRSHP